MGNPINKPLVGDQVWLHSPPQERMKKFTSLWKGPYTILDKPGIVNYKIQLIGGYRHLWYIETD